MCTKNSIRRFSLLPRPDAVVVNMRQAFCSQSFTGILTLLTVLSSVVGLGRMHSNSATDLTLSVVCDTTNRGRVCHATLFGFSGEMLLAL